MPLPTPLTKLVVYGRSGEVDSGCPPLPPGSIRLRSSGAGRARTGSNCTAGWRTGLGSNNECGISWSSSRSPASAQHFVPCHPERSEGSRFAQRFFALRPQNDTTARPLLSLICSDMSDRSNSEFYSLINLLLFALLLNCSAQEPYVAA